MTDNVSAPKSRRALLAAAAGGAVALAASAALPLTAAAADPNDVVKDQDNPTTLPTSVSNSTADSTALAGAALGTGFGLQGTSTGGFGVFGWSISAPPALDPASGAYTGAYGWSPTHPDPNLVGVGVWGDSGDWGVFGSGNVGVYGYGNYGIVGESLSTNAAVLALARSATDLALDVRGKVKFSRSGRSTIGRGKSSRIINLGGVSTSSQIFALIQNNRSGRWVRAVVPASGKFTIYLNATLSSTTYVAWFILN
jgi:hypothetical protein